MPWTEDFELEDRRQRQAGADGCLASHWCPDCGLHLSECECDGTFPADDAENFEDGDGSQ